MSVVAVRLLRRDRTALPPQPARSPPATMPSSFSVAAIALAALSSTIDVARAQILADGNYFQAGNISPTWRWQASGVLYHGRCPFTVASQISDCYGSCVLCVLTHEKDMC